MFFLVLVYLHCYISSLGKLATFLRSDRYENRTIVAMMKGKISGHTHHTSNCSQPSCNV